MNTEENPTGQALAVHTGVPTQAAEPRQSMTAGGSVSALVPQSLEEVYRLATAMAASNMMPRGYTTKEQVMVGILAGSEVGLKPFQSVQSIAVVNGRPTLWGDAIPALLWSHGFKIKEWFENSDPSYPDEMVAKCLVTRPTGEEIEGEFSVADAKEAKLWTKDGPWQTAKKRMMKMRARAFAARDGAPDVLRGLHVREEVEDYVEFVQEPAAPRGRKKADIAGKLTQAPADTQDVAQAEDKAEEKPEGFSRAHVANETGENDPPHDAETGEILEQDNERQDDPQREVIEHANPGEFYLLETDEMDAASGRWPLYKDGSKASSVGEKGLMLHPICRSHPPKPPKEDKAKEEPKKAAAGASGIRDNPEDRREPDAADSGMEEPSSLDAELTPMNSWLMVKARVSALTKDEDFKSLDVEDQAAVRRMIWGHVLRIKKDFRDPVDHASDVTAFLLWIETLTGKDGADAIEGTLRVIQTTDVWTKKLNDVQRATVEGRANVLIARLRTA